MQPQLLIFDLDGTLVDSRADLAAGIFFQHGIDLKQKLGKVRVG